MTDNARLADDMLRGAGAIAEYLLGDAGERRKVYHAAHAGQLPHFRIGAILCARKSTLARWIAAQEAANDSAPASAKEAA